uniref:Uncharacterized protein n=1 Tax=Plectus sambesii TaxID=2011161 RepID=A0A914W9J2_9BILA
MNHPLGTLLILTVVIAASRAENEQVTSWFQPWYETYYRRIFSLLTP